MERGTKAISDLCLMTWLNMMEEEFRACRMEKHKRTATFLLCREMERDQDNEKREEEREWKHEKVCRN
jgi:hypothetical protein